MKAAVSLAYADNKCCDKALNGVNEEADLANFKTKFPSKKEDKNPIVYASIHRSLKEATKKRVGASGVYVAAVVIKALVDDALSVGKAAAKDAGRETLKSSDLGGGLAGGIARGKAYAELQEPGKMQQMQDAKKSK